ncbi:hypothetical protein HJG60_009096 [Phyllostomus discolor]|uniref:Uncharacterized protein n=1 Tax=Phyllostomus discolor TaxID=89673 RepID=A0A834DH84_9CHIR|nr:hypothetical protein HJG60_009096 [Phyllostomus discolor]
MSACRTVYYAAGVFKTHFRMNLITALRNAIQPLCPQAPSQSVPHFLLCLPRAISAWSSPTDLHTRSCGQTPQRACAWPHLSNGVCGFIHHHRGHCTEKERLERILGDKMLPALRPTAGPAGVSAQLFSRRCAWNLRLAQLCDIHGMEVFSATPSHTPSPLRAWPLKVAPRTLGVRRDQLLSPPAWPRLCKHRQVIGSHSGTNIWKADSSLGVSFVSQRHSCPAHSSYRVSGQLTMPSK